MLRAYVEVRVVVTVCVLFGRHSDDFCIRYVDGCRFWKIVSGHKTQLCRVGLATHTSEVKGNISSGPLLISFTNRTDCENT
jgi:hypothetical protein